MHNAQRPALAPVLSLVPELRSPWLESALIRVENQLAAPHRLHFRHAVEIFSARRNRPVLDCIFLRLMPGFEKAATSFFNGSGRPLIEILPRRQLDRVDCIIASKLEKLAYRFERNLGSLHLQQALETVRNELELAIPASTLGPEYSPSENAG
jgi:hypothetical protein